MKSLLSLSIPAARDQPAGRRKAAIPSGSTAKLVYNFGLSASNETVIGKMFGVLLVLTRDGRIGYLSAFSGKLAGSNRHKGFVPSIFDGLADGGFVNAGITELSDINEQIRTLETRKPKGFKEEIQSLKTARKIHSSRLQNEIYANTIS